MKSIRGLGLAMSLATVLVAVAAPARPASADDLSALQERAQAVGDEVGALEHRLAGLEVKRAELEDDIEATTARLALADQRVQESRRELRTAEARFIERAVESYKAGASGSVALLLSASSLSELEDLAQVTQSVAAGDADTLESLAVAEDGARQLLEEVDAGKQELLAEKRSLDEVDAGIESALGERRSKLADLRTRIGDLERKARQAARSAARASGTSVSQALLDLLTPSGPASGIPEGFAPTGVTFEGIASWYGPGFEGNHTANGDIFDSSLYTAASKELPLGSWLYVEHEGRGVVVLINDRGPYVGDRVLDLSHAAAQAIGIGGIGWVTAHVLIKV